MSEFTVVKRRKKAWAVSTDKPASSDSIRPSLASRDTLRLVASVAAPPRQD